jgi:hypothetical protein
MSKSRENRRSAPRLIVLAVAAANTLGVAGCSDAKDGFNEGFTDGVRSAESAAAPTAAQSAADDKRDSDFVAAISDLPVADKQAAIGEAKALCEWLVANNAEYQDGGSQVRMRYPDFTVTDAGEFLGSVTAYYCPDYAPPTRTPAPAPTPG